MTQPSKNTYPKYTLAFIQGNTTPTESKTQMELTPKEHEAEAYYAEEREESAKRELETPTSIQERVVSFITTPFAAVKWEKEKGSGRAV